MAGERSSGARPGVEVWDASRPAGSADLSRVAALLASRLPERLGAFAHLAYDLGWSWSPAGRALFRELDPHRFEACGHDPVRLLLELPPDRLGRAAADRVLAERADALLRRLREERRRPFLEEGGLGPRRPVAFLCAEFAVHHAIPIYAGGLGILAGDWLKEASDRSVPMVGVGLCYRQGQFHQRLDPSGWQTEYWLERGPELLPLAPVTRPDGGPLAVRLRLRGRDVWLRIWIARAGRIALYLLDSDVPENARVDRWITARLYDPDREVRLTQYAALGIGGVRALRALGVEPSRIHLNEGHAALAVLERLREERAAGHAADAALRRVREGFVFTTHTPLPAGNESYAPEDLRHVLGDLAEAFGAPEEELLALGRVRPGDGAEPVGLTVLALRGSGLANGVSRRHGEVAREMWRPLWPRRSSPPIAAVTNGVHLPTWMSEPMRALLGRHLGPGFEERAADPATWRAVEKIPDEALWEVRCRLRAELVAYLRERSVSDRLSRGEPAAYVEAAAAAFDPDVFTVGFARRLTAYKRLHLLAKDPARSVALLRAERPLQIALAGKAHPRDEESKRLLQRVFALKKGDPAVGRRVVFLDDYGVLDTARLVAGCDLWLNLPRPPLEACGTSGMKSVLNGGLQLSVLDGWWAEAWREGLGWAVPADPAYSEDERDDRDAARVYEILEREAVPLFYERDARGLPRAWLARVKASLAALGPFVCAGRMLDDYVRWAYRRR